MRIRFFSLVLLLPCFSLPLRATLQQGQKFGKQMLNQYGTLAAKVKPAEVVPQYTPHPAEARLTETTLDQKTGETLKTHPSAKLVKESEEKRGRFFRLQEDPLVLLSKDMSADPLALLSRFYKDCREVPVEGSSLQVETETRTCEEAGEPYTMTCTRDLVVTVTKIPPDPRTYMFRPAYLWDHHRRFWHTYFRRGQGRHPVHSLDLGGDNKGGDPGYAKHYTYVLNPATDPLFLRDLFAITREGKTGANWQGLDLKKLRLRGVYSLPERGLKPYKGQHFWLYRWGRVMLEIVHPPVIQETWTSNCAALEEKIDQGVCQYVKKTCTQEAGTRLINGEPVTRPCWQETYTYQCTVPARNDCEALRAKGCRQVQSHCKQSIGQTCVLYMQTFTCQKSLQKDSGVKTKIVCGEAPRCLTGDCAAQGYPLNGEMLQAISQLSVLKELQNQIKNGMPEIFRGSDERCSRNVADFRDCCGSGGGWGTALNLAACSPGEKALSLKRQKKQCRQIGTYCSRKVLGVCVEKKTTFCCFGSSFLRMIQEQARGQLRLNWGEAENPRCRGLTVEELTRVDFSKLDLSEVFQEISGRYKQPQSIMTGKKIKSRMEEIQDSIKKDSNARQRGEG